MGKSAPYTSRTAGAARRILAAPSVASLTRRRHDLRADRSTAHCASPVADGALLVRVHASGADGTAGTDSKPALPTIALKEVPAFPLKAHVESADIVCGGYTVARLVDAGGDLFHTPFNGLDGVGSFVREDGSKVARFAPLGPRGPSAQACGECHAEPFPTFCRPGAQRRRPREEGHDLAAQRAIGDVGLRQRHPPTAGAGDDRRLCGRRARAACSGQGDAGHDDRPSAESKGTSFGSIAVTATAAGVVTVDTSKVVGVDPDLVVRPLGWKGDVPILRNFSVGAAAGAMGLVADELVWKKAGAGKYPDVDGDGVGRELSVGDITAMTVYMAAQETPTEAGTMATLGYAQAMSADDRVASRRDGRSLRRSAVRRVIRPRCRCSTRVSRSRRSAAAASTTTPRSPGSTRTTTPSGPLPSTSFKRRSRRGPRRGRRRRDHPALWRPQAACDGPAARRPGGHQRLDRRGPRAAEARRQGGRRFLPTSS